MAELAIGVVAARSGIAASAIRFYEREGLLAKAPRKGGRRVYGESVLDELALIELAKSAGFTVSEIKKLLSGFSRRTPPGERWRALTRTKMVQLNRRIAEAERMKHVLRSITRCRCPSLDDCGSAIRANRPE
jgi:MerR family redox-sensitive transcriptional activator SoxR